MTTLSNWHICSRSHYNYTAPEQMEILLQGIVYDHPKFQDGDKIVSSRIIKVNGPIITTKSGTVYHLGKPNPKFVQWCKDRGCHVPTKQEPIKLHA